MNYRNIELKAKAILLSIGDITLPIKIEELVKSRGLKILPHPLEDDISGMLIIKEGIGTIAYNQHESAVRRRFTIAHEFGHYELHRNHSSLFFDKSLGVLFRSQASPETFEKQKLEREANAFAAALLMPEDLLKNEIQDKEFDFGNDKSLDELAKTFNVSSTAMYYRMANLGLI